MGYWGKDCPAKGGEHKHLAALLEKAIPFRATAHAKPRRWIWKHLKRFIEARQAEAKTRNTLAAIKYPQLCQAGRQLRSICGDGLRVIVCDRPVQESIDSLIRRTRSTGPAATAIADHQRWLAQGRDAFAAEIPDQVCRIAYDQLLEDPAGQLNHVADWLGLQPTADQLAAAVAAIDPAKRHITSPSAHTSHPEPA